MMVSSALSCYYLEETAQMDLGGSSYSPAIKMSTYSILEQTLKEIVDGVKPLRDDWGKRFEVINDLRVVVQSVKSLRGATVEPFGSFVSNLFTRWGDLDLSVDLHNSSFISPSEKKHKQNLLSDLHKAMRKTGGWLRLQLISHARVPILKVESRHISCDISINNLEGQMKSKLLFWISLIDTRFSDMVLLVKEWAKAHNINNPKAGTFNSYSLSLLVIFHFQTCRPAILPPLRDIYPGNVAHDLTGVRAHAENHVEETCAANITRFRSNKSRAINRSSLADLFISFLAKFSDLDLKASELGISPFRGQWDDIKNNTRWLPQTYALFIEDPFEQPENSTRAINTKQLPRISEVFKSTYHRLISVNQNQRSLLSILVQPQTSRFISRAPVHHPGQYCPTHPPFQRPGQFHSQNNKSSGGYYQLTQPQLHQLSQQQLYRSVYSPSPVQPQMWHYNNSATRRPVQTCQNGNQNQGGRRWIPRSE